MFVFTLWTSTKPASGWKITGNVLNTTDKNNCKKKNQYIRNLNIRYVYKWFKFKYYLDSWINSLHLIGILNQFKIYIAPNIITANDILLYEIK